MSEQMTQKHLEHQHFPKMCWKNDSGSKSKKNIYTVMTLSINR